MFTTDKNIPPPEMRQSPTTGLTKYFRTMEINDSFLIDESGRKSIYQIAKQCGLKIKTAKAGTQIRVWRIA